jgi:hypothetical protein
LSGHDYHFTCFVTELTEETRWPKIPKVNPQARQGMVRQAIQESRIARRDPRRTRRAHLTHRGPQSHEKWDAVKPVVGAMA